MTSNATTKLDAVASVFVGMLVAAILATITDSRGRSLWLGVSKIDHVLSLAGLMFAVAGFVAALCSLPILGAVSLRGQVSRRWVNIGFSVLVGLFTYWIARDPVSATLAGVAERAPDDARNMRRAAMVLIVGGSMGLSAVLHLAVGWRPLMVALLGVPLIALGSALAWADSNILVALYANAHDLAEMAAWSIAASGAGVVVWSATQRWPAARVTARVVAAVVVVWTLVFTASSWMRAELMERRLIHVWREPGYASRMCLRVQLLEGYLRDPSAWRGFVDSRLKRLVDRYDIATVRQSAIWDLPREGNPVKHAASERPPLNVVVIFVDTLRADTAMDPAVMPRLNALRQRSLSFTRAYAGASDTVSSLPVMTGGCFGTVPCEGDMLAFAKERGIPTSLVIAKSARLFLEKNAPHFQFSDVSELTDYAEGKRVWGYGADRSTADTVTRDSLAWMAEHRDQQFMLWSFHFDVHNWMNLDPAKLNTDATRYAATHAQEDKRNKYNAACAGVDAAIGGLIDGISELGLAERTAVLVVSDHGEALGHRGHAFHAVYLWESLVKVPLVLHVPGMPPEVVDSPVGQVDVAPTVVSLLEPSADQRAYHGVSLLADAEQRDEALPLLMFSMRKDDLLRIGLIGRRAPFYKLEIPFDSVEPELYDLSADNPDAANVRHEQRTEMLQLLSQLVTSPVFPRAEAEEQPAP